MWLTFGLQSDSDLGFHIPTVLQRLYILGDSLSFYIAKILLPISLAVDYGRTPDSLNHNMLPILTLLSLTLELVFLASRKLWTYFWLSLFTLLSLAPVSALKPFVFQTTSSVADRYLYPVLIGLALLVAHYAKKNWTNKYYFAYALLVGVWAALSFNQSLVWKDSRSLWTHTLHVNRHSWLAENNLGVAYEQREEYDEALKHFGRSVQIKPQGICFNNMGAIYLALKQFAKAEVAFQAALQINPNSQVDAMGLKLAQTGKERLFRS